jgi:hypothetical protein
MERTPDDTVLYFVNRRFIDHPMRRPPKVG